MKHAAVKSPVQTQIRSTDSKAKLNTPKPAAETENLIQKSGKKRATAKLSTAKTKKNPSPSTRKPVPQTSLNKVEIKPPVRQKNSAPAEKKIIAKKTVAAKNTVKKTVSPNSAKSNRRETVIKKSTAVKKKVIVPTVKKTVRLTAVDKKIKPATVKKKTDEKNLTPQKKIPVKIAAKKNTQKKAVKTSAPVRKKITAAVVKKIAKQSAKPVKRDSKKLEKLTVPAAQKKSIASVKTTTKLKKVSPTAKNPKVKTAVKAVKVTARKADKKTILAANKISKKPAVKTAAKNTIQPKKQSAPQVAVTSKSKKISCENSAALTKKKLFLKTLSEKSAAVAAREKQKKALIKASKIKTNLSARQTSATTGTAKNTNHSETVKSICKSFQPIAAATLRGKKLAYQFEVFSLEANFSPLPAIYVISRRVTDQRRRSHQKLICIGETESIVEAIKMHRRERCIKKHEANVVCILKEENEKNRQRIEADLKAAHAIACNQQ